jgi:hypothetical protein
MAKWRDEGMQPRRTVDRKRDQLNHFRTIAEISRKKGIQIRKYPKMKVQVRGRCRVNWQLSGSDLAQKGEDFLPIYLPLFRSVSEVDILPMVTNDYLIHLFVWLSLIH